MAAFAPQIKSTPLPTAAHSLDRETARKKNGYTELFHRAISIQDFNLAEQITKKDLELDQGPSPTRIWIPASLDIAARKADHLMNAVFTEEDKNQVYGQVYILSKDPQKGGLDWGRIHAHDDRRVYVAACTLIEKRKELEKKKQELDEIFSPYKISDFLELPNLKNYSQINRALAVSEIDRKLAQKSPAELNTFYGIVYQISAQPKGGDNWGKNHAKDDLDIYIMAYMQFELQTRRSRFESIKQFLPRTHLLTSDFSPFTRTHIDADKKEVRRLIESMSPRDQSAFHDYANQRFPGNYVKAFLQFNLDRGITRLQETKDILSILFDEKTTTRLFNECPSVVHFLNEETGTINLDDLIKRKLCLVSLHCLKKLLIQKYPNIPCMYQACKKIETALINTQTPLPEIDRSLQLLQAIYEENYSYHEAESSFRFLVNALGIVSETALGHQLTRVRAMQDMQQHYFHDLNDVCARTMKVVKGNQGEILFRYKSFREGEFPINAQREVLSSFVDEAIDSANALPTRVPKLYSPYIPQNGTFQQWAKDASTALNLYKSDLPKLMACEKLLIHHNALLSLIKARGDGHLGNTLFQFGMGGEIANIIDCDDEDSLPWENHQIGYVRMWILGHPQCENPFDRATLLHFSHERLYNGIIKFAENYKQVFHENKRFSQLPPYHALKERLQIIQNKMKGALESGQPLTPRDLFFALFGGKGIYDLKKSEGLDPILIFNYFLTRGSHLSNQLMPTPADQGNTTSS